MPASPSTPLDEAARRLLARTAAAAIQGAFAGESHGTTPDFGTAPARVTAPGASFVTLMVGGNLRGCRGTLEPLRPLLLDVWRNAQSSAFDDPRFPSLDAREWHRAALEIAVLSGLERMTVGNEAELLRCLRPGTDGLVLDWRGTRATFLPKVWQQVGDPREFVVHLKQKAGWRATFWADDIVVSRYVTESIRVEHPAAAADAA